MGCSVSQRFIKIPNNSLLHAYGNEPGWNLRINNDRTITWINNYGQDTLVLDGQNEEFIYSKYTVKDILNERMYFAEEDVTIDLRHEKCSDDMSGEGFTKTIIIIHASKTYRGCANFEKK